MIFEKIKLAFWGAAALSRNRIYVLFHSPEVGKATSPDVKLLTSNFIVNVDVSFILRTLK